MRGRALYEGCFHDTDTITPSHIRATQGHFAAQVNPSAPRFHKTTPKSPHAQFGWSEAATRGHNSTRRPPERKRAQMERERELGVRVREHISGSAKGVSESWRARRLGARTEGPKNFAFLYPLPPHFRSFLLLGFFVELWPRVAAMYHPSACLGFGHFENALCFFLLTPSNPFAVRETFPRLCNPFCASHS